jgi:hypothetical protein
MFQGRPGNPLAGKVILRVKHEVTLFFAPQQFLRSTAATPDAIGRVAF